MSVAPKELTKSQRDAAGGTSSMVQVDSGDSGGGIVMNCFYRFALIGIVTESLKYDYKSKGAQVFPHLDEICEITGVCPIERMKTIFILIWISLPITTSEFVSPADKFEGLSKISKDENSQVNELCGLQPGLNKINSGTIAKKGQFPWAVAIEGRRNNRFCSGTIISQRHVLTAAHCAIKNEYLNLPKCQKTSIESESKEINKQIVGGYVAYGGNCNYAVLDTKKFNVSGSPCKRDDMTRVLISAVTWEKRYRDRSEEKRCTNFDIAIIEVARDFKWSKFVRPVCLTLSDNIFPGMIGMFYGFGTVKTKNSSTEDDKMFFPDLRYGAGYIEKDDTTFTLKVAPKSMTEDERTTMGTCSNAQIESGDSGGGIVMNSFSRFSLIGISTDSLRDDYMSKGAQVFPHLGEICEITGVCPIEGFEEESP